LYFCFATFVSNKKVKLCVVVYRFIQKAPHTA